ncbi:MAG: hypothetical protein V3S08_04155 [Phycisphaerales bacterium]
MYRIQHIMTLAIFGVLTVSRIAGAQTCTAFWDTAIGQGGSPGGLSSSVYAIAEYDDGNQTQIYVGGDFPTAGGVSIGHGIARWDGTGWSDVDGGMSGDVFALTVFDDGNGPALYAGGLFGAAGGVTAKRVARWDGTSWSAVGNGVNNEIHCFVEYDDGSGPALYAGGEFSTDGSNSQTLNNVAKWDGTAWVPLGSGVQQLNSGCCPSVDAMAVYDDGSGPALYVGGNFDTAGGASIGYGIARWDGAQWSSVGSGVIGGRPRALLTHNDGSGKALYVGGWPNGSINAISRWNGASWTSVGNAADLQITGGCCASVYSLASRDGLYVGGHFSTAAGTQVNNLARWDGTQWSAVGNGVSGCSGAGCSSAVWALATSHAVSDVGPALYAGGTFTSADGVGGVNRIAAWTRNIYGGDDTDGDALFDFWEYCGGIDINEDGLQDLNLQGLNADPLHKDIFLECDTMFQHGIDMATVFQQLVTAFNNAPVSNPDGVDGIDLYVQTSGIDHFTHDTATNGWDAFDTLKDLYFGQTNARMDGNWPNIRKARLQVFRYGLAVHQYYKQTGTDQNPIWETRGGTSEIGGNDFIVSLGADFMNVTPNGHHVGTANEQAGLIMHELGHTLGLAHGGNDNVNYKPNYRSVMSYTWALPAAWGSWKPDYSNRQQNSLNEANLNETTTMDGDANDIVVFASPSANYATSAANAVVDWNQDGDTNDTSVAVNLNEFSGNSSTANETLVGHDDWANLQYDFRDSGDFLDYRHDNVPQDELTPEAIAGLRGGTPDCPVARDDDGDMETAASIDYNDDSMEKIVDLDTAPADITTARLWLYGQPYNYPDQVFQPREDYRIRVNDVAAQEIVFDVGAVFNEQTEIYQWIQFDVPVDWLVEGFNNFFIYAVKPFGAWDHNNLRVAVDTDTDVDGSWWCGNGVIGCNDPTLRDGELMVFLEYCPSAPPCPADLDGDGAVGIVDFLDLLAQWGTNPGGPPDLDGDGNVGITDFLELLASWGPC